MVPAPKKDISILLVEDNPDDIFLLRQLLSQSSLSSPRFQFKYAHSLAEAEEVAKNHIPDIIILDLSLPDAVGIDSLTELQSRVQDIPIVVLTALKDSDFGLEMVSKGAQDYLVKGELTQFIFTRTVLHAIERHRIRQEYQELASELQSANSRLEKLILLDPLTGLLNRRGLQEALSREIERVNRTESDLIALILDLDNFKRINDTLGHAVGDVALKEIAQKLIQCVRATDYVARIGGDEFMVLMPDTRFGEGMIVAGKIRRGISGSAMPISIETSWKVTASLGLVAVTPDIVSIDELLAKTHHVLYQSKKSGKNKVSCDNVKATDEEQSNFSKIISALREKNQYQVLKQPIYRLKDEKKIGYEFLSRFTIHGLEMPDDFFRVCQENNILSMVDRHCFQNCISAGHVLPEGMKQHLNLFPSTMIDTPTRSLTQTFEKVGNLENYCIEISEQQIIGDPSYLMEPVRELKKMGIQIAIDDVGFGRSCLESLILLEPDVIKIDKKWVNGIARNPLFERSLRRLMKITNALGTELVAEGIETREDMDVLIHLGVEFGQGYYLGKPA